jgi:hypothetical protein
MRGLLLSLTAVLVLSAGYGAPAGQTAGRRASSFEIQEATIDRIQDAIRKKQITTRAVVEAYLRRIKAYNGACVNEPQGILGRVTTIAHAGQINALSTLNLRPAARAMWGFDTRKARTLTNAADDAPAMPDALETAAQQDREFARTALTRFTVSSQGPDTFDTHHVRRHGHAPTTGRPRRSGKRRGGGPSFWQGESRQCDGAPAGGTFCPYDCRAGPASRARDRRQPRRGHRRLRNLEKPCDGRHP